MTSKRIEKDSKRRIKPYVLIKKATNSLNNKVLLKYGTSPKIIETKSLEDDNFQELFDFKRIEKVQQQADRQQRYNEKLMLNKRRSLRDPLEIGEEVLILSSRIRKTDAPGVLYKSSTDNRPFFNRKQTYKIASRTKIDEIYYYWVDQLQGRFLREELFAINNQFN